MPAAAWFALDRLIFYPRPVISTARLPAEAKPFEIVATDGTRLRGWMRVASGRAGFESAPPEGSKGKRRGK